MQDARLPDEGDDAALLARVAQRDDGALEALVARYGSALRRFLQGASRDHAAADDALQETFLSVWRHAGSFRGGPSARGWLFSIARHALLRARRTRIKPTEDATLEALGAEAGWGSGLAGAWVERALMDRQRLERAFGGLGDDDHDVLLLVDGEGLSLHEAADALTLSVPALKSRLHRARLRVLAKLKEDDGDGR